ncbi:uncharacterized protein LOC121838169 [Ixodes scapularis]|uniref:uncharacterized protein LOC121838169 n=1 Tax=Ixodes scapularis TaxID=6945 RepID=UPI001C390CE7|nr:uncharacterized protein LOC121838169 [Ixodes scapularis]
MMQWRLVPFAYLTSNVRACLQEIQAAKMSRKSTAVEYEGAPLLLLTVFEEDKDLFYKVIEETGCDDDLGDMPGSPFICAKGGSFVTAKSFTICIDSQPVVHTSSPCQAFKLVFFAHFAFNVVYRMEASLCLEFTQRDIAAVNPGKGTKVQRTKSKQHCLTPKVAALVTALPDYDF